MGKNNKKRHAAKGGAGKPKSSSVSLSSFRAARALDSLAPAFVHWFDDGMPGAAAAAMEYLKLIEPVLSRYLDATVAAELTSLDPAALADAVSGAVADAEVGQNAEVPESERAAYIVDAMRSYVEFLAETGRWTGSGEQLAHVQDYFEGLDDGGGQPHIEVPDISDDEALAAFRGLPLIQRASALLSWIGDGKPVTGTGALRLRDIEAAAACVGVAATGSASQADTASGLPVVRSMHDVPLLARMWAALQAAGLIDLKPTKVVPAEGAPDFLDGTPSVQLARYRRFANCFLDQSVFRLDPAQPWEASLAALQVSILTAATTSQPPQVERVLAAPEHAPEEEQDAATLLTTVGMERLRELAELGLLAIDTHFHVPSALIGSVAEAIENPARIAEMELLGAVDDEDAAVPAS